MELQMEMQLRGLKELLDWKPICNLPWSSKANYELHEFRRRMEECNMWDVDYKNFWSYMLPNLESAVLGKKRKENDDADDEVKNDPQYEAVLKCLTAHEKSYVLKSEKNGLPVVIKYEEVHSVEECDPEPRRKLRSATKQKVERSNQMTRLGNQYKHDSQSTETKKLTGRILRSKARIDGDDDLENSKYTANRTDKDLGVVSCDPGPRTRLRSGMKQIIGSSNGMPGLENQSKHDLQSTNKTKNLIGRKLINKVECGRVQNVECTTNKMVPDPAYQYYLQNSEIINGDLVFTYGGLEVLQNSDGEHNQVRGNHNDGFLYDVQIIGHDTFYNAINGNNIFDMPTMESEFRQLVINILRRPYDKEEHEKLWQDIELHKPQGRHRDLRSGRERSCPQNIDGKSYLDHHPDLKRKLSQCKDDKLECLNLLRGYFFWLEKAPWSPPIIPWQDAECLAIKPGSC